MLLEFTESTFNPRSQPAASDSWCLVCCKCKQDCYTCVFFNKIINYERYLHVEGQYFQQL
jgi:hypothetical protein